ncbi:hypothetical protein [Brevundimonas sp.]|uniref:hypothetical protein n=1 Tax=Brevundimonas sp. TaxID=1871086 RepID=UPI002737A351|nr:hypothetical protein [Brevundimonas sp.]MDP3802583.1 hypothetical protein [Brevundimonas sp.]
MTNRVDVLIDRIRLLEHELEAEFSRQRSGFRFGLEHGRARFEEEAIRRLTERRIRLFDYVFGSPLLVAVTAPVIYSLLIPFALVDLWVSIYQAICFRVYRIPRVRRGRYMNFDRTGLPYLNALEKLNCAYCSYVNGVIAYVGEIASRTEQYWCPIKHTRRVVGAHARYDRFEDFGDGEGYRSHLEGLRTALRTEEDAEPAKQ